MSISMEEPSDDRLREIARNAVTRRAYSGGVKALRAVWRAALASRPDRPSGAVDAARARRGMELLAAERERQIGEEGYTPEHDSGHARELSLAASCYAANACGPDYVVAPAKWPWRTSDWKPSGDPVRDLTKAGALIAAAIDAALEVGES